MTQEPGFLVTSHSIDGTFESCPRRFMFRHLYEEMPLLEPRGLAADVGTALHEAVQDWTRHGDIEKAGMTLLRWWPWQLEAAREEAKMKDHKRTLGNALMLMEEVCKHPFWESWEVATLPNGEPAIELPFRIEHKSLGTIIHPVTKQPLYLATQGKMDWILRHKKERWRYMVTDLKTTILNEPAQQASFRFSGQAGQYGLVLSHAIGQDWQEKGIEVTYFVAEFSEFGMPIVSPMQHALSPTEVAEAIEAKNERLRRMINMGETGFWPRRSHGCAFYQVPCGFLDICHRSEPDYLWRWFEASRDKFSKESRLYDPFWTIEA